MSLAARTNSLLETTSTARAVTRMRPPVASTSPVTAVQPPVSSAMRRTLAASTTEPGVTAARLSAGYKFSSGTTLIPCHRPSASEIIVVEPSTSHS
jgi:hypothetical protein